MKRFVEKVERQFIAGLDLGQSQDYSALAIIENEITHVFTPPKPQVPEYEISLSVRHLERWQLGTA